MWGEACEKGQSMRRGDYYSIKNIKMKWSQNHSLEGTFSEAHKVLRLDEKADADMPEFKALLQ